MNKYEKEPSCTTAYGTYILPTSTRGIKTLGGGALRYLLVPTRSVRKMAALFTKDNSSSRESEELLNLLLQKE